MTTLIPFESFVYYVQDFYLVIFFICKTVQMLAYKFKHVPSLIMAECHMGVLYE